MNHKNVETARFILVGPAYYTYNRAMKSRKLQSLQTDLYRNRKVENFCCCILVEFTITLNFSAFRTSDNRMKKYGILSAFLVSNRFFLLQSQCRALKTFVHSHASLLSSSRPVLVSISNVLTPNELIPLNKLTRSVPATYPHL